MGEPLDDLWTRADALGVVPLPGAHLPADVWEFAEPWLTRDGAGGCEHLEPGAPRFIIVPSPGQKCARCALQAALDLPVCAGCFDLAPGGHLWVAAAGRATVGAMLCDACQRRG